MSVQINHVNTGSRIANPVLALLLSTAHVQLPVM